jgi:hypothetical protein
LAAGLRLLEAGRTARAEGPLHEAREYFVKFTQQNPGSAMYW